MRKFIQRGGSWSKELLAKEVLAEIPDQMLSYMKSKGFKPSAVNENPPIPSSATAPII